MDQQLKQRLIGATIIVSLVVIFVPMLFEDRQGDHYAAGAGDIPDLPKEVEAKSIELPKTASEAAPSAGEGSVGSGYRIIPLTDEDSSDAENEGRASGEVGISQSDSQDLVAGGGSGVADDEVFMSAGDGQTDAAPSGGTYAVRGEAPGTAAAPGKPQPAPGSKTRSDSPALTAKRNEDIGAASPASQDQPVAGPKTKPKALPAKPAEKASKKPEVAKASRSNPNAKSALPSISPQKLTQTNAPDAADDLAAWVVQTGSFTTESNARSLAEKLRKLNFPAFVEVVSNAGTSIYRVQVGPALSRTRAEQVQKQIENTVGVKGIVIPHP
jgi:DedD protein